MARMTIAQLREKAVFQIAQRKTTDPTEQDIAAAKTLMHRFYLLCGLDEQLLYLENDERTYNRQSTKDKAAKRDRLYNALIKDFEPYNATLVYYGYCPTITSLDRKEDLYLRHFYN